MEKDDKLTRREFIQWALTAGAVLGGLGYLTKRKRKPRLKKFKPNSLRDGVAVAYGEDPALMTERAVAALGGMSALVSPDDVVVIKPNIAWDRAPEFCATTNPEVVASLVRMCRRAGAKLVKVFDFPPTRNPSLPYKTSGIAESAERAGAVVKFVDPNRFVTLQIPDGYALSEWDFYAEAVLEDEVDVLINVPVAKHHGTSRLTLALKNIFGIVDRDRGDLHRSIHEKIVDLNRVVRVDLTVLDAYRVLRRNGPTGGRLEDVDNSPEGARRIIVSKDPVAVDACGATLFGIGPKEIGFIRLAEEAGLGSSDFKARGFYEVKL